MRRIFSYEKNVKMVWYIIILHILDLNPASETYIGKSALPLKLRAI